MYQLLAESAEAPASETGLGFWETLQQIGKDFAENTGLAIVRTLAFLVLGLVVIKIVQAITRNATLRSSRLDNAAASFIISVVTVILYVALIIILVSSLGFSTAGIIAGFSAVALAIALALKDSLGSLANGVIIIFTKPFKKGDYVQINEYDGLVQDIRLFNTKILTYSNEEIIIPNSEILSTKMINYSAMPLRRVVIDVPVPYDADTGKVREIILNSLTEYKYTVKAPAPSVVLKEYGASALMFSARAWALNENYWDTLYDLTDKIFNDLKAQGISIPFNQMDVRIVQREDTPKTADVRENLPQEDDGEQQGRGTV
ncbi:MAG TPA: mechanosensitive ion channel family protein [Candidatus Borkfalkia excrementipullorum]|nr:mechanosensitive ion channel family protein [Candidatus Borkfalkia excrementipullorum]